jgi:hypothetical protein
MTKNTTTIDDLARMINEGFKTTTSKRPVSSNGAENRGKASSLLNRFSILLKNKKYVGGRNPASRRVTVAVRLRSHRKRPRRRHGISAQLLCKPLDSFPL